MSTNFTKALLTGALITPLLSFSQSSIPDSVLKSNVAPINQALQKLVKLQPKTFQYNNGTYQQLRLPEGPQFGFMADNMEQVFPELVHTKYGQYMFGKNVYKTVSFQRIEANALIPVLVASIQELNVEVQQLKATIQELKKEKPVTPLQTK